MTEQQLKEYEEILDVQNNLISKLNAVKQRRDNALETYKKDKNMLQFDNAIFELELESQLLLEKMQENFERIKSFQAKINK